MLVHCVVKHSRPPDLKSFSNVSLPFAWITGPQKRTQNPYCLFCSMHILAGKILKFYEAKLYLQHHVGLILCRISLEWLWLESSRVKNSKVRHHTVQDKRDFAYFICLRNRILSWFQLSSFDICTKCKSLKEVYGSFLHMYTTFL